MASPNVSSGDLTPRQLRAIEALAAGRSVTRAATAAGVTRRTVTRWRAEVAGFETALREARDVAFRESLDELRRVSRRAVTALAQTLGATGDAALRVRAAAVVLATVLKAHDSLLVEDRLRELERRVGAGGKR